MGNAEYMGDGGNLVANHKLPETFPTCNRGVGVWRWRTGNTGCIDTWASGVEANGGRRCANSYPERSYTYETFSNCFDFSSTGPGQGTTTSISDSPISTGSNASADTSSNANAGTTVVADTANTAPSGVSSPVSPGSSKVYTINIQEVYEGLSSYEWGSGGYASYQAFEHCWQITNLVHARFAGAKNLSPFQEDQSICLKLQNEPTRPTYKLKQLYYPTGQTRQASLNENGTATPIVTRSDAEFNINIQELYDALSQESWVDGESAYLNCWGAINGVHARFALARKMEPWSKDKSICTKLRSLPGKPIYKLNIPYYPSGSTTETSRAPATVTNNNGSNNSSNDSANTSGNDNGSNNSPNDNPANTSEVINMSNALLESIKVNGIGMAQEMAIELRKKLEIADQLLADIINASGSQNAQSQREVSAFSLGKKSGSSTISNIAMSVLLLSL